MLRQLSGFPFIFVPIALLIYLLVVVNGSSEFCMLYFFSLPVNKNNLSWHFLVLLMGQNVQLQTVEKLKDITRYLVRIIVRQCEVHTSERIRRSMQLYTVYSRMWGEEVRYFYIVYYISFFIIIMYLFFLHYMLFRLFFFFFFYPTRNEYYENKAPILKRCTIWYKHF